MSGPSVRDFYTQLGITLLRSSGSEAPARCFASPDAHRHDDRHPSVSVSLVSGAWMCHACGARGGAYDAALLRGYTARSAMELLISHGLAEPRRSPPEPIRAPAARSTSVPDCPRRIALNTTEAQITAWCEQLAATPVLVARLAGERGITAQTLAHFDIGFDGSRMTIPVRRPDGAIAALLRWLPFRRGAAPKMLAVPGSKRDLFPPPETHDASRLLLCEGEPDALAAHAAGIPAVAVPGAASWRAAWATRFIGREIAIVLGHVGRSGVAGRRGRK